MKDLFAEPEQAQAIEPDIILPHRFTARAHQRGAMRFFDGGGMRYSGVWHRRAGKDRVMLAQASKMAHRRVGTYWHCLPTLKQGRKVIWDNITKDGDKLIEVTFPPLIVAKTNETEMKIELRCGSVVQIVGADNIASNLGANPLHITFSEWALTDPMAWQYTRPILLENEGTAAFISTPRGYNHAYDTHEIAKRGGGWLAETFDIDATGLITREQYLQEIAEGMPEELARQEYYVDFSAANVGSVLGKYVEAAEREGRISEDVHYDPEGPPVEITSDIGFRDAAAWWVWQALPGGFKLIAYDEDRGLDADDWVVRLKELCVVNGWQLGRIWLPHDARVKTFQSKRSSLQAFIEAFGVDHVRITSKTSVSDYVNAARTILKRSWFAKSACAKGLRMLRDWHYAWNDEAKTFSKDPEHDYASHGGEAFCYGGVALAEYAPVARPAPAVPYSRPANYAFNLEQLYEARDEDMRRGWRG